MAKRGESKSEEPVSRRVDGFVWLARHSRKVEIVAFVRGTSDKPPDWLRSDRVWPKVERDRAIWKAAHANGDKLPSLRDVADSLQPRKVSHQMVANVLGIYSAPGGPKAPKDTDRLKLRSLARKALTRKVVDDYYASRITAVEVAELIGGGADYRNAVYWLGRMRKSYQKA